MDTTLVHYGVLGMKWGVRKSRNQIARANQTYKAKKKKALGQIDENATGSDMKKQEQVYKNTVKKLKAARKAEINRAKGKYSDDYYLKTPKGKKYVEAKEKPDTMKRKAVADITTSAATIAVAKLGKAYVNQHTSLNGAGQLANKIFNTLEGSGSVALGYSLVNNNMKIRTEGQYVERLRPKRMN